MKESNEKDSVTRFLFELSQVRGEAASLSNSVRDALATKAYPHALAVLVGEALTAAALLADTIKIDGSLILQLQGDGMVDTLVAQATDKGELRGLVHWNDRFVPDASFSELLGNGRLVMTIDGEDKQRYQGVVEIIGESLSESIEAYFQQSEQLATRLWLACDGSQAGGLLLQQMPESKHLSNDWHHLVTLASTISGRELVELNSNEVIHRLFHQEELRVFDAKKVSFHCSCSRKKIENVLLQLGKAELDDIVEQDGEVKVDCEFCNLSYQFDAVDISSLFLANKEAPLTTQ